MKPDQLRMSCMDQKTRNLIHIRTTDDCKEIVSKVMGGSSNYRKDILKEVGVLGE